MRPTSAIVASACALTLGGLVQLGDLGRAGAQQEFKPVKNARGGLLAKTAHYQFEALFYATGVRLFAQDHAGTPLDASRLAGSVTFYHPNSSKPWFSRPLHGASLSPGQAAPSLDLAVGLSNAPPIGAKATFEISGLPRSAESKATFTLPVEFVPAPTTQPTPPQESVATVPRFFYGPGSRGYGYYEYTSPGTYSTPSGSHSYMSSIPGMYGPGGMTVGPGHRDWTTGRSSPLAKPWLRAMD